MLAAFAVIMLDGEQHNVSNFVHLPNGQQWLLGHGAGWAGGGS